MPPTRGYEHLKAQAGQTPGQGKESSPTLRCPVPPCLDTDLSLPVASSETGTSLGSPHLSPGEPVIFAWKKKAAGVKIPIPGNRLPVGPEETLSRGARAGGQGRTTETCAEAGEASVKPLWSSETESCSSGSPERLPTPVPSEPIPGGIWVGLEVVSAPSETNPPAPPRRSEDLDFPHQHKPYPLRGDSGSAGSDGAAAPIAT